MITYLLEVFAILFVAVGPIDNAAIFAGLTANHTPKERNRMALRASLIAGAILIVFPIIGDQLLHLLNIQLYSLQVGGGVLLFLVAIDMVMTEYENGEQMRKKHAHTDYSVFPLAIPLMAGPATIIISMNLFAKASGDYASQGIVLAVIVLLMLMSYIAFLGAGYIVRFLGTKGAETLTRALGVLLGALAAELVIEGLRSSGLFMAITG